MLAGGVQPTTFATSSSQVTSVANSSRRGTATDPHFQLEGDSLALTQVENDGGVAVLRGTPGIIRTLGLELLGEKIRLDRGQNQLWIDGPGSTAVPLPEKMASSYPPHLAYARVSWQRELRFDGRTASCDGAVEVRGPAQLLRTSALRASLATPVDLRADLRGLQIAVDQIQADSDVWLENRAFDSRGLVSIDSGQVKNLRYDYPTGRLEAAGPGWVRSVRLERDPLAAQVRRRGNRHKRLANHRN